MNMTSGGARTKSGPPADPKSLRSAQRGISLTLLPSAGYAGEVPDLLDLMPEATAREMTLWKQMWSTPQATAWAKESWRWATVADLAMYRARAENPEAPAATATTVRQLRDDLGLSQAGLAQNGWAIAHDETTEKREAKTEAAKKPSARDRFKVVSDGTGA